MEQEIERRVRERAYAIWEQEGRPHGKDREHWERAKRQLAVEQLAGGGGLVTHPETAAYRMDDDGDE